MNYKQPTYWKVVFFPELGARNSPDQYIKSLPKKEKVTIRRVLRTLETIEIVTEWSRIKSVKYDGLKFLQLTVGRHRFYLYLDAKNKSKKIAVCYACPKKSQKAKKTDLNRAVTSIRNYMRGNG